MAVRQLDKTTNKTGEWLKLANRRVEISNDYVILKYQPDVDLLAIRFTEGKSTYSRDDMEKGIIYNYDENDILVSVEILDLYGVFATLGT